MNCLALACCMLHAENNGVPHMEWDSAQFSPSRPKPPPKLMVNVSVMSELPSGFEGEAEKERTMDGL